MNFSIPGKLLIIFLGSSSTNPWVAFLYPPRCSWHFLHGAPAVVLSRLPFRSWSHCVVIVCLHVCLPHFISQWTVQSLGQLCIYCARYRVSPITRYSGYHCEVYEWIRRARLTGHTWKFIPYFIWWASKLPLSKWKLGERRSRLRISEHCQIGRPTEWAALQKPFPGMAGRRRSCDHSHRKGYGQDFGRERWQRGERKRQW